MTAARTSAKRNAAKQWFLQQIQTDQNLGPSDDPVGYRARLSADIQALAVVLDPKATILDFDPQSGTSGGFGITVVYGDLPHAVSVGVLVGGVNTDLGGLGNFASASKSLQRQLSDLGKGSSAVVAWMGYSAPDLVGATSEAPGLTGAAQLSTFVRTEIEPNTVSNNISLIGHSYGSYVVSAALQLLSGDQRVKNAILLASPGVDLSALGATQRIWAGVNSTDPIQGCAGGTGGCISGAGPGAYYHAFWRNITNFPTNGPGYTPIVGHDLYHDLGSTPDPNQQGYLDFKSRSLLNVAQIMTGGQIQ